MIEEKDKIITSHKKGHQSVPSKKLLLSVMQRVC